MTTARQDLVTYLRAALPVGIRVLDSIEAITNAKRAVVMVSRSGIQPAPIVDTRDDVLTVWLLSPFVDIGKAEDDLDVSLDAVTDALDAHEFLHWDSGERDVFDDSYHAFRVNVTHRTITTKE